MTAIRQSSAAKGEIFPDLYGRNDQTLYEIALRKQRNFINSRFGPLQNRPGTQFIGRAKSTVSGQIKLIPFIFSQTLSFVLEFGNLYLRFWKNGAQVTNTGKVITAITQAAVGVVTSVAHGFSNGDEVVLAGIGGMTLLNGRNVLVAAKTADTFRITDLDGVAIDTSGYDAYTTGGTASKVYELTTPYVTADLQNLNYIQSANVLTIANQNYQPADVSRVSDTSWTYTPIVFKPAIDGPSGIGFTNGPAVPVTVSSVTQSTPATNIPVADYTATVIHATAHGFSNGDLVKFTVLGMLELNEFTSLTVANAAADTFEIVYTGTTTNVDSSLFNAFVSGSVVNISVASPSGSAVAYQVTAVSSSNQEESLPGLGSAQNITGYVLTASGNVVRLTKAAHGLSSGDTVSVQATNPLSGVDRTVAASGGIAVTFRSVAHGLTNGDSIYVNTVSVDLSPYVNVTLAGSNFIVANKTADTFELTGVTSLSAFDIASSPGFMAYSQPYIGAYANQTWAITRIDADNFSLVGATVATDRTVAANPHASIISNAISTSQVASVGTPNIFTWAAVAGAQQYNVYKATNGIYGFIGSTATLTFTDDGIEADLLNNPPIAGNPFNSPGNYPAVCCYYQQRLCFANTANASATCWLSQAGRRTNFTTHIPQRFEDAVSFTLVGNNEVNPIVGMIDLRRLVLFTAAGEWQVLGNVSGAILATDAINISQASANGSNGIRPLIVNSSSIYCQFQSSMVRDLKYQFTNDNYDGKELSVDSSHLIDGYSITDWCFQRSPNSIIYATRSDGILLAMTYFPEQEMVAWSRHDWVGQTIPVGDAIFPTVGSVENVVSVPETGRKETSVYVSVSRLLGRETEARYIERLAPMATINDEVQHATFMDSFLKFDGTNLDDTLTMLFSGGTTYDYTEHLTLTASAAYFTAASVGEAIFVYTVPDGDGTSQVVKFQIDEYVSTTQVKGYVLNSAVPAQLQAAGTPSAVWARAIKRVGGLWHLYGNALSILGDGNVVANPFNSLYTTKYTVDTDGGVTLDNWYSIISAGLPITSDFETLDVDPAQSETMMGKKAVVTSVSLYMRGTRGVLAGAKEPPADVYGSTDTSQRGLEFFPVRSGQTPDAPGELLTEPVTLPIQGAWTRGGRVFFRQTDPLPMVALAWAANGNFPVRQKGS